MYAPSNQIQNIQVQKLNINIAEAAAAIGMGPFLAAVVTLGVVLCAAPTTVHAIGDEDIVDVCPRVAGIHSCRWADIGRLGQDASITRVSLDRCPLDLTPLRLALPMAKIDCPPVS